MPKTNELFESWLVRLCSENMVSIPSVLDTLHLENLVGSSQSPVESELVPLSEVSGIPTSQIRQHHVGAWLSDTESVLAPHTIFIEQKAELGIYHKACSQCLLEMKQPFLYFDWALNWMFFCEKHQQPLRGTCTNCRSHYRIHLSEHHVVLGRCWKCGYDLAKQKHRHGVDLSAATALQNQLRTMTQTTTIALPNCQTISGQTFAKHLSRLLREFQEVSSFLDFAEFFPNILLEDSFSLECRQANGFYIIAWALSDPISRIPKIQTHIRSHLDSRIAVRLHQVFQQTLEVLCPHNF